MDIVSSIITTDIRKDYMQEKLINNSSFKLDLKSRVAFEFKSFKNRGVLLRFGFDLTLSDILLKLCFCEMILKFLSKKIF